jgi:hypothetical protein
VAALRPFQRLRRALAELADGRDGSVGSGDVVAGAGRKLWLWGSALRGV